MLNVVASYSKASVLTVAVLFAVGCGKSKESKDATSAQSSNPPPVTTSDTGSSRTGRGSLTLNPTGTSSGTVSASGTATTSGTLVPGQPGDLVPVQKQKDDSGSEDQKLGENDQQVGELIPKSKTSEDQKNQNQSSGQQHEKSNEINQSALPDFSEVDVLKTGGLSPEGLFYAAQSDDGLMSEFKSYAGKVSNEQKQMNANLAKGIRVAKMIQLTSTTSVATTGSASTAVATAPSEVVKSSSGLQANKQIEITVDEFGQLKTYVLKTTQVVTTSQGDYLKLSLVSATGDLEFQGGFLKCLKTEADAVCDSSYAKLKFSGAYTRIIFRKNYVNRNYLVPTVMGNDFFNLFKFYIDNTVEKSPTNQKIISGQVASFEVVGGVSAMGVLLLTQDREQVGLTVPVIVEAQGTATNVNAFKSDRLAASYDLPQTAGYKTNLMSSIADAKLVAVDGRGGFKLKLNFAKPGQEAASIWLVAAPVKADQLSVDDVRRFESQLKPF